MDGFAFAGTVPERPRDRARSAGIALLAVVVSVAAATTVVGTTTSTRSWFPKAWDPRVAPIADAVARLRNLEFDHPVAIHYLEPKDFEKQLGIGDPVSGRDRTQAARDEAVLRAVGLIGGNDDLLKAALTSAGSSVLAYYDPDAQEIFVRGTTLDVAHRVTVAHEMTHVLQDQHFDLRRLDRAADRIDERTALSALVEGDAVRIQDEYLKQLSPAERREYEREDAAEGARVAKETTSVPAIVGVLAGAPYEFGPSTIRVLLESGGNAAVDDALTGSPPSSSIFVDTGDVASPDPVDDPLPPAGAERLGNPESFDGFETFLTLATRIDPVDALAAADEVGGGRALAFRSDGVTCYRVVLAVGAGRSREPLASAVDEWARGRARTAIDDVGEDIGFTACDPGKRAPEPPSGPLRAAVRLLAVRTGITVGAAGGHTPGEVARCIARLTVGAPGAAPLLVAVVSGHPTYAQSAKVAGIVRASRAACRVDPDRGLT